MAIIHPKFRKPRLPRIVIIGPPGSGKTTMIKTFQKELKEIAQPVPEAANMMIVNLGIEPGKPKSEFVFESVFQHLLYRIQELLEHISEEIARNLGKKILIADNGCVGIAAFLQGGISEYEELFKTTLKKDYNKYDLILFLELPSQKIYNKICKNNPARSENYNEAKDAENRVKKVWEKHPRFTLIPNSLNWGKKVDQARLAIKSFLNSRNIDGYC